ncbi:class F sortase [Luteococcus peritonei]|uniref:Class F sortase n=1 Tax=Luteococcus peritonei TaxID=88874 RepID=A0ABW4RQS3_9ACTN
MGRTRRLVALLSGILAVVLAVGWWQQRSPATSSGVDGLPGQQTTGQLSTATSRPSGSPAPSSTPAARGGLPAGCARSHQPIVPTRIQLRSMDVDSPVLSLGLADDGTPETPPYSQPFTVGWYNRGPRPGATQGKAVLTAHTFSKGHALGNALAASDGLKPGAVIAMSDAQGRTLCWTVSGATKVWVKDYDPNSTLIYDDAGAPQLAIVICWDYEKPTRYWASRIVYHAVPLVA